MGSSHTLPLAAIHRVQQKFTAHSPTRRSLPHNAQPMRSHHHLECSSFSFHSEQTLSTPHVFSIKSHSFPLCFRLAYGSPEFACPELPFLCYSPCLGSLGEAQPVEFSALHNSLRCVFFCRKSLSDFSFLHQTLTDKIPKDYELIDLNSILFLSPNLQNRSLNSSPSQLKQICPPMADSSTHHQYPVSSAFPDFLFLVFKYLIMDTVHKCNQFLVESFLERPFLGGKFLSSNCLNFFLFQVNLTKNLSKLILSISFNFKSISY